MLFRLGALAPGADGTTATPAGRGAGHAGARGRGPGPSGRCHAAVARLARAPRAAMARRDMDEATRLVPEEAVDVFACGGTLADCRRRLEKYLAAGIEEPVLVLVGEGSDREKPLALINELTG